MRAGNITDGVDHRQHNQPERQGHADVGDGAARHLINDNRSRPDEDQSKGTQKFRN